MKKKVLNIEFSSRIKELRYNLPKRDGNIVLQREVAKEAGISISSYQQAEKGFIPGRAVLTALSEYFNKPKKYIEKGQVAPGPEAAAPFRESKLELQDGQAQDPFLAAITDLREIFDSRDQVLIPAIQANIRAFQLSARREHQNTRQAHQIKALQDECDELKKRIDTLEKTCAETSTSGPEGGNINRKVI